MSAKNSLLVSEKFYSIQGEGITTGYPSYFIRLANCNLNCGAHIQQVNDFKKGKYDTPEELAKYNASPYVPGASWRCDTIPVWSRGKEVPFQSILDDWKKENLYEDIKKGIVHIIWTGGEPCIPMHQEAICDFHDFWGEQSFDSEFRPFVEIETNGTRVIDENLMVQLDQINCSPKLSNSGMPAKTRIVPAAIVNIMSHLCYQFKFVISTESDIQEMFDDYINPFQIPLQFVVCMPGLDKQSNYFERTKWVMEMAKKYKFVGLSRQHVAAWDQVTGV